MMWVDPKASNRRGGNNDRQVRETDGDKNKKKRPRPKGAANQTVSGIDAYRDLSIYAFRVRISGK